MTFGTCKIFNNHFLRIVERDIREAVTRNHPRSPLAEQNLRVQNIFKTLLKQFENMSVPSAGGLTQYLIAFEYPVDPSMARDCCRVQMVLSRMDASPEVQSFQVDLEDLVKEIPAEREEKGEIPNILTIKGTSFRLSPELLQGMRGRRNADHKIDLKVLEKALEKKRKKLNLGLKSKLDNLAEMDFDYYFYDLTKRRVLNVYVKVFPKQNPPFVVHTAYYMLKSLFNHRFNLVTDAAYDHAVSQLPTLK